jgi:hypothetical protein
MPAPKNPSAKNREPKLAIALIRSSENPDEAPQIAITNLKPAANGKPADRKQGPMRTLANTGSGSISGGRSSKKEFPHRPVAKKLPPNEKKGDSDKAAKETENDDKGPVPIMKAVKLPSRGHNVNLKDQAKPVREVRSQETKEPGDLKKTRKGDFYSNAIKPAKEDKHEMTKDDNAHATSELKHGMD